MGDSDKLSDVTPLSGTQLGHPMIQIQVIAAEGIQEGFVLMLVGLSVVFSALILIALGITLVQAIFPEQPEVALAPGLTQSGDIPPEHIAIIAAASVALLGSNFRVQNLRPVSAEDSPNRPDG